IPRSIPKRLPLVQDTSGSTNRLHQLILARAAPHSDAAAPVYQLNDSSSDALTRFLISKGVQPDGLPGRLAMLRATHGQDPLYFFKNESGDQKVDAWVPLQHKAKHAVIGNARTGSIGLAQSKPSTNGTSVHLVLEPTEVLVVRLTDQPVSTLKQLNPSQTPARTEIVKGPWALSWTDYQGASHGSSINELASWTQLAGLELYSGSVGYETSLVVKPEELSGLCELDLGAVHESADVWVNGEHAGCIWTTPYRLDITRHLHPGRNTLRLNVVNLAQNRIIDMQRNHIPWQKCRLEENDFQGYCGQLRLDKLTPLKSGLLGPVKLLKHPRS
ncbi:MAG: glycosylhydrolase-like jelly roll fold domain-containing protein, partial [Verrucomicrobiota bacterium]